MEFVVVRFPEPRTVQMEGLELGPTGQVLLVERGTHIFDLGSPVNYAPVNVQTVVAGTTETEPLAIEFQRFSIEAAAPAAAKKRAKKAPKRKAQKKRSSRKTRARKTKPARRRSTKKRGRR
jgi:hypothetical protein